MGRRRSRRYCGSPRDEAFHTAIPHAEAWHPRRTVGELRDGPRNGWGSSASDTVGAQRPRINITRLSLMTRSYCAFRGDFVLVVISMAAVKELATASPDATHKTIR
jgi:hypothetical protein